MKKGLLIIALILGTIEFSNAQISYGIKGGLNYASPSDAIIVEDGSAEPNQTIDANTSWHAGAWMRVKIPVVGLYVRPEVVFTSINSSVPLPDAVGDYVPRDFKLNRVDIPVLVGLKFLGFGNVFAGPVFEYVTKSDLDESDIKELNSDDFFVGAQIGVGIEFWKLGLDVRYETAFSTNVSDFAPSDDPLSYVSIDNSPDQFIVGLSYKF